MIWRWLFAVVFAGFSITGVNAQTFSAEAQLDPAQSQIVDQGRNVLVELHLSQGVPFRVSYFEAPYEVRLSFEGLRLDGIDKTALLNSDRVKAVSLHRSILGTASVTLELDGPRVFEQLGLSVATNGSGAVLRGVLSVTDADVFAARASDRAPVQNPESVLTEDEAFVIVIDPGHGGRDPGAQVGEINEADLMLVYARSLREALLRAGIESVVLTRVNDGSVPLARRITVAHEARADMLISLHADILEEGRARGTTVYTLSNAASDAAAAMLAERHERDDLIAGVDLSEQEDGVVQALMALAQTETGPRSRALADHIVEALQTAVPYVNSNPRRSAAFSVLKAPDVPSVLVELGFLSDPKDLENLLSPVWREKAVDALVAAILTWRAEEAAQAANVRR